MGYSNIVILTGAGLSAESGVPTFRDKGGIWAQYDYRDVATPEGFARNPKLVHEFYNMRRRAHADIKANAAHHALARLEREHPGNVTVVTQNVDALHEQAGSQRLIHMHGEIMKALCARCGASTPWTGDLSLETTCAACDRSGGMRPDVVWFGEMPYHMERHRGPARCGGPFHLHRHQRKRLSGRGLRGGSAGERRAHGGAQSRAFGGAVAFRRSHPRAGDGGRAGVCGAAVAQAERGRV